MYVDLLTVAMSGDVPVAPTSSELLAVALQRREQLLKDGNGPTRAEERLAHEVAYDRTLISLCTSVGLDAEPARFANPKTERARLEGKLLEVGVDLNRTDLDCQGGGT
jgi:hypothetical protein